MDKIRAAFVRESGGVEIREVERPTMEAGGIMVRMEASGVCGTDLEKLVGKNISSNILGHEVSGIVTESLSDKFKVGERVVPHHHVQCGKCNVCKVGAYTMCPVFKASHFVPGGFADEFMVPPHNVANGGVHLIKSDISFNEASFAEPLGCCIRGLSRAIEKERNRKDPQFPLKALVVGAGPIGLLHMELLRSYSKEVRICSADISKKRLEFSEKFEDAVPLEVPKSDGRFSEKALKEESDGFDLVIVATGIVEALTEAIKCVRKSGKLLLFGVPHKGSMFTMDLPGFFQNELTMTTSYATTESEISEALRLLSSRKIDVDKFITATFPLERISEGMSEARSEDQVKVIITK